MTALPPTLAALWPKITCAQCLRGAHHPDTLAARQVDWVAVSRRRADSYLEHHRVALRQQQAAFRVSLVARVISMVMIVVGVGFALFVTAEIGVLTSVAGLLSSAVSGLLFRQSKAAAKRAAESLRLLTASVERSEAIDACLRIADGVRNEATRDRIVAIMSLVPAFPEAAINELSSIVSGDALSG